MRDFIVFAVVFGLMPFVLKRPVIGVMTFTWLSMMNPHRLAYGAAYNFQFAAVVVGFTLIGLVMQRQKARLPITRVTVLLMLFMTWMTLTTLTAFEPERAWGEWSRVMKTLFMVLVTMATLKTKDDIKMFAWVVGLSLGFYGFKGGLFTALSGGSSRVLGPDGTYITDNNDLALALLATTPLIWYLQMQAKHKLLRIALIGLALLTLISVLGSYSRGALLGASAMLGLLWFKSRNKLTTGLMLVLLVPLVFFLMPEAWFSRMETIDDYKADYSAMGRINAWHFATNLAMHNLMGGGFLTFTQRMFAIYAPDPLDLHAPHSIYFQVLGEHGFIGLAIFLALLFFAWRTASRIVGFSKNKPDLKWASDLAAMSQVSLLGYAVGGAFLSLAYFDLLYNIILLPVLLEKLLLAKKNPAPLQSAPVPGAPRQRPAELPE
jgi:probable O-glycosylation ligase (exosortase A-associated)